MRVFFIYILIGCLGISDQIFAQNISIDSVAQLQEVSVYAQNLQRHLVGNKVVVPMDQAVKFQEGANLNDLLQLQSNIHMKTYGNGMLSSIAFRGTTASQTSVIWNNFNINNYTLGQLDFSLIPVFALEEIILLPGGGSTFGGNGAIGGSIALQSSLKYKPSNQLYLQALWGSYDKYQSSIQYKGASGNWAYHTNVYYQQAKNDFYIERIDQKQKNAAFNKLGLKQQIGYRFDLKQKLELAIWYHHNNREIQPAIRSTNSNQSQVDDNLRSSLKYLYVNTLLEFEAGSGFFLDELNYRDNNQLSYYSTKRSENYIKLSLFPYENHHFTFETRANLIQAFSDGFDPKNRNEQRYTWNIKASGQLFNQLAYAAHLSQQWVSNTSLNPLNPYLGFMYPVLSSGRYALKLRANGSYNYRVPTLNDRFWEMDDREPILPERGLNLEFGMDHTIHFASNNFNINATVFQNQITNYIQWVPVNGQARPINTDHVEIKGLELEANHTNIINKNVSYQISLSYAYNDAKRLGTANEEDKQLVYVPLQKGNASFQLQYKKMQWFYSYLYTSKVYTTAQNSESYAIPFFTLHNLGLSYQFKKLGLAIKANNLFNTNYQTYLNYAMPGRNFELSLNYKLNLNKNE